MEVGDEAGCDLKLIGRKDEYPCIRCSRHDVVFVPISSREILECAEGGRSDWNDGVSCIKGVIYGNSGHPGHGTEFMVERARAEILLADGCECSSSDVERYERS